MMDSTDEHGTQNQQADSSSKDDNNNTSSPSTTSPPTDETNDTTEQSNNPTNTNETADENNKDDKEDTKNEPGISETQEQASENPAEENNDNNENPEEITVEQKAEELTENTEQTTDENNEEPLKQNEQDNSAVSASSDTETNKSQESLKNTTEKITIEKRDDDVHEKPADNANNEQQLEGDSRIDVEQTENEAAGETNISKEAPEEKETLRKEVATLYDEVKKYKDQAHEFTLRCEQLENKLEEAKTEAIKKDMINGMKKSKRKPVKRRLQRIRKSDYVNYLTEEEENTVFESTDKLYAAVAARFPDISISQVLMAEKKFIEVDKNDDGTIYSSELEMVLDGSDLKFTKEQVSDVLRKVDVDSTGSLDFFECLTVIDFIRAYRSTVPEEKTKSSLCVIM